jgi:Phage protein Gp138 N-terminal domain
LPVNDTTQAYPGFAQQSAALSGFDQIQFMIDTAAAQNNHCHVVKVLSVTNSGAVAAVGFVDVMIMTNMVDADGNATPHGTIHNCPYSRLQGGANAIILDPQVGDIGWAVFADRDISSVKANKAQANPGSSRRFSASDGIYLGGILNGVPVQLIQFNTDGITVTTPQTFTVNAKNINLNATEVAAITAPNINLNGLTSINGELIQGTGTAGGSATFGGPVVVTEDVTAGGISVINHIHSDAGGSGPSGPPVPGT